MKKFALIVALLMGTAANADDLLPWQETAVELAREEGKVMDAMWSQSISFWVIMADDGTRRDGYASYLCLVLNQAGRPQGEFVSISVWDAATAGTNSPRKIGQAMCN